MGAQSGTIPTPVVLTFKGAGPLQPSKRILQHDTIGDNSNPVVLTFKGAGPLQPSKRIWHNQGQFQPQSCLLSREPDPYNRANVYGTIRDNSNPSRAYFQGSRALTTEQTHTT